MDPTIEAKPDALPRPAHLRHDETETGKIADGTAFLDRAALMVATLDDPYGLRDSEPASTLPEPIVMEPGIS